MRAERPPSARDLEDFARALSLLVQSGLGASRSLAVLSSSAGRPGSRALAFRLRSRLSRGQGLGAAIAAEGKAIPPLFASLVATAEGAGRLGLALQRLSSWLTARRRFRDSLLSAAAYPCLVLCLLCAAIVLLKAAVLPRLASLVQALGPSAAAGLDASMHRAGLVASAFAAALALLACGAASLWALRRSARAAEGIDRLLLRLPLAGPLVARRSRAEFAFSMEGLCAAGVPPGAALSRCAEHAANAAFAADLRKALSAIRRGEGLAPACSRSAFFDAESLQWLALADSGGNPQAAFAALRSSAESAQARAEAAAAKLIDPLLTLFAGGLVASFVALFVLPVFTAMGSLLE